MRRKIGKVLLAATACCAVGMTGCGNGSLGTTTCSSPDSMTATTNMITTAVEKDAIAKSHRDDGTYNVPVASIRASVALLKVSIDEIRTTKSDPSSTKQFCAGTAKIVFPLNTIDDADKARSMASMNTVAQLADASNVQRNADAFTFPIEYDVQPTDNKKETFAEAETIGPQMDFLAEVVNSALLKTLLQNQQTVQQQQAAQQEALNQQAIQAKLDQATNDNKLSVQDINAAWNSIAPDTRDNILADERAWIAAKNAQCNVAAASASTDPSEREAARLNCDTAANQARMAWIQQYMPSAAGQ